MTDFSGPGHCTCGLEMEILGTHCSPRGTVTWRSCQCGISAAFFVSSDDYTVFLKFKKKDEALKESEEILGGANEN